MICPSSKSSVLVIGALLAAAVLGCSQPQEAEPAEPVELQGAILVLIDTVRADHLSCYGYPRTTSPAIDRLARNGIRFERVIANSPWTLPSVAGLLSGQYPERVFDRRLKSSLVERLAAAGVVTAAVTEGGYVSRMFGMDRGFSSYGEEQGVVQLLRPGQRQDPNPPGGVENTFARAKEWLRMHKQDRFFLFIHTYEPHSPYTNHDFTSGMDAGRVGPVFGTNNIIPRLQKGELSLSKPELEYVTALYDGDIRNADRHLGSFLDYLAELELDERTLVVVTSDHGEELGDQYPSRTGDHGHSLLDPLLLVPLVIHDPVNSWAVQTVTPQVRLIDVMPTIADLLQVPLEGNIDGRSLVPMLEGSEREDRLALAGQPKYGSRRIGMRHLGYKYIATIGPGRGGHPLLPEPADRQLYDLGSDPIERNNLVQQRRELAEMLHAELERHHGELSGMVDPGPEEEMDPAVLERLKSLGYVQ
jgi:arylsulfatase A-like enzyme